MDVFNLIFRQIRIVCPPGNESDAVSSHQITVADRNILHGIIAFRLCFPPYETARIVVAGTEHHAVVVAEQEAAVHHDVVGAHGN